MTYFILARSHEKANQALLVTFFIARWLAQRRIPNNKATRERRKATPGTAKEAMFARANFGLFPRWKTARMPYRDKDRPDPSGEGGRRDAADG